MNPDHVNAEALRSLKELHTKLILQREKRLLNLIAHTEYIVKYMEFLKITPEVLFQSTFSQFLLHWLHCADVSSTTSSNVRLRFYSPVV